MADKGDYATFYKQASAVLKGKKNAASGRAANAGIRGKLASAMYKGNAATRNNILRRYAAANGVPAAAAVAAGVAVAKATTPGNSASNKITQANAAAAKVALNAALSKAGQTRKASIAAASQYAKLLKQGNKKGAKELLDKLITKASEKGAEAAAGAAVKAAKANVGMSNEQVGNILRRNLGKGARPSNIAKFKQALAEGKSEANAVAAVAQMRKNAAFKSAATKKAKKANSGLSAAVNAANKTGAAGAAIVAPAKTAKKALVKAAEANKFGRVGINNTRRALLGKAKFPNYGAFGPGRLPAVYNVRGSPNSRRTRRNRRN